MPGASSIYRAGLFTVGLALACGPGPDTTSATSGTTVGASSSSTAGGTTTSGGPSVTSTSGTSESPTTGTSSTGAEEENPCGCMNGDVCIQTFDGICTLTNWVCLPNPDGCVPGWPCSEACRTFCDGDSADACNNSDCPEEIEGAVHCFGH